MFYIFKQYNTGKVETYDGIETLGYAEMLKDDLTEDYPGCMIYMAELDDDGAATDYATQLQASFNVGQATLF